MIFVKQVVEVVDTFMYYDAHIHNRSNWSIEVFSVISLCWCCHSWYRQPRRKYFLIINFSHMQSNDSKNGKEGMNEWITSVEFCWRNNSEIHRYHGEWQKKNEWVYIEEWSWKILMKSQRFDLNLAKKFCTVFVPVCITFSADIVSATTAVVEMVGFFGQPTRNFHCTVFNEHMRACLRVLVYVIKMTTDYTNWKGETEIFSYFSIDTAKHKNYCSK